MNDIVCTTCGHIGKTRNETPGSTLIELVLWLCFLIPGLIYSIWRLRARHPVCPKCGNAQVIPRSTPMAQKFIRENFPEMLAAEAARANSSSARAVGQKMGRTAGRFFK